VFSILTAIGFFLFIENSALAGIFEPLTKWNKKEIQVCFVDKIEQIILTEYSNNPDDFSKQGFSIGFLDRNEKLLVEQIITSEYQEALTGIYFSGWRNCSEIESADTYLFKANPLKRTLWFDKAPYFKGRSSIGNAGVLSGRGYESGSKRASIVFSKIVPATIVHEFGHLSGLRHEHINPKADSDPACWKYAFIRSGAYMNHHEPEIKDWISLKDKSDVIVNTTVIYTDYDKNSAMNYCFFKQKAEEGSEAHLSSLDQQTLKYLYHTLLINSSADQESSNY